MHRARGYDSDNEEPSEEDLMLIELAQLERRYRTLTNDYKAYKDATKRVISKQDELIVSLEKEEEELMTCMSKMETTQNKTKDDFNTSQLMELSRFEKKYQALIVEEQNKSKALDAQIKDVENQITDQRKKMGGVQISTQKYINNTKKRRVLENRLNKAMVQFNQQLAVNSNLRNDIDHLRRERSVFDNLYKKLSKELNKSKRSVTEVIEASTLAFEQRDEAQSKMSALQERHDKEHLQHMTEMKELQRIISHDDKIKKFMTIKASDRATLKAEESDKKRQMRGDIDKAANADLAAMTTFEESFKEIQQITGQDALEEVVDNFIQTEDQNFALFNYVNELNTEVETLTDQVKIIQGDIEKFTSEDAVKDGNHKQLIRKIEGRLNKAVDESKTKEVKLKQINKTLDNLMSEIHVLFSRLGCDAKPIQEMLGEDQINHKNVMIYMGLIEQKTSELIHTWHYIQAREARKNSVDVQVKQPPKLIPNPQPPAPLGILPPSTEDDEDDEYLEEDDFEKPLTKSELKMRVAKNMIKRNIAAATQNTAAAAPAKQGGRASRNKQSRGPSRKQ